MKPIDKLGRPIYGRTWERITNLGRLLVQAGYEEHGAKPNLFVRRDHVDGMECRFYADLRGTDVVPIWEDSNPLFYAFFRPDPPIDRQRELWLREVERLGTRFGVSVRFSFYATSEPDGILFGHLTGEGDE